MGGVRNKYCLKSAGMIMTLVNIAFIIVELFLCGYQFRQTHQNWTSNGEYRVLGILQLSTVIFIFVSIVIGFLLFSWLSESKGAHCVFILVNGLSMLLTLATSIFTLIAASIGNINDYVGCQKKLNGFFTYWNSIDYFLSEIDNYLCSNKCQCYMTNISREIYKSEPFTNSIFDKNFIYTDDNNGPRNIQDCPETIKKEIKENFDKINKENFNNEIEDININKFATYWRRIEEKFECSGFCNTIHKGNNDNNIPMIKFMFTDVNIGIPKRRGCMIPFMRWIKKMLLSFGVFTLLSSIIQIGTCVSSICLFCLDVTGDVKDDLPPGVEEQKVEMVGQ